MRLHRSLLRIARDRRGASVIEVGIALPMMMIVLGGLIDVARCYSSHVSLQQAAARALERVQVGNSRTDFSFVQTEAATAANVPVSQVATETWLECNQVRQPATTQDCAAGQARARYVQVTITSSYSPFLRYSPLGTRQSDGTVALTARSSVRYQ